MQVTRSYSFCILSSGSPSYKTRQIIGLRHDWEVWSGSIVYIILFQWGPLLNGEPSHPPQCHAILLIWPFFIGPIGDPFVCTNWPSCGVWCSMVGYPLYTLKIKSSSADRPITSRHFINYFQNFSFLFLSYGFPNAMIVSNNRQNPRLQNMYIK